MKVTSVPSINSFLSTISPFNFNTAYFLEIVLSSSVIEMPFTLISDCSSFTVTSFILAVGLFLNNTIDFKFSNNSLLFSLLNGFKLSKIISSRVTTVLSFPNSSSGISTVYVFSFLFTLYSCFVPLNPTSTSSILCLESLVLVKVIFNFLSSVIS